MRVRRIQPADFEAIVQVINDAAQAYRGIIPADCWHDPYMPAAELAREIEDGVEFWAAEDDGQLLGVMGVQDKADVALVRHAYTATASQGKGAGTLLLRHVAGLAGKPLLIGTWAAASWAIAFYQRNGFSLVSDHDKNHLLKTYWSVPPRQIETSVVLADRQWTKSHGYT